MNVGMTLPTMVPGFSRDLLRTWCHRIDTGPYTTLAAGERITFPNAELMVSMSAAAALTERVRLALTIVVLPLHSPVLIAKQAATLDVMSGGRLDLGLGVGGREEDYRAADAMYERRGKRLADGVARMRAVWAGEPPHTGAAPVGPTPIQPGGPRLFAGAMSNDGIRRAARWADGIFGFSFGPSPREVGAAFTAARAAWQDRGRAAPRLVASCWFALGPDARAQMDTYVHRYLGIFGPEAASTLAARCKCISATALRETLTAMRDLGADELLLVPTTHDPTELDRVADILC